MMLSLAIQHWSLQAERLQSLLTDVSIKSVILIAAAGLIVLVLRRASAAQRHLVWLLTLVGMLCLPFFALFVPSRQISDVRPKVRITFTPAPPPVIAKPKRLPALPHTATINGRPAPTTIPADINAPEPEYPYTPNIPAETKIVQTDFRAMIAVILCSLWLLGVKVVLGRLALALVRLQGLRCNLLPLTDYSAAIAAEIMAQIGLRQPVRIARSNEHVPISVPLTWGFWRPIVVLPAEVEDWAEERLRAALLHELAHVQRGDWMVQILASLTCALYWFNPLIWLAARGLRQESERAADDYALTHGLRASDYANHLMEIALTIQDRRRPPRQTVAMVHQSKIEARLRAVLARGRRRQQVTGRLRVAALAATVLLLIAASTVRFSSRAVGNPAPPQTPAAQTAQNEVVAEPMDAPVVLSNGVTVRLIGVRDSQKKPDRWWKPDGTFLTGHLPSSLLTFPRVTEGGRGRVFAVAASYDLAAQPKSTWVSPPKYVGRYYARAVDNPSVYYSVPNFTQLFEPGNHLTYVFGDQYQESTQGSRSVQMGITAITSRPPQKTTTLICGVAAGPWTESVTCKKTPGKVSIQVPSGQIIFTLILNPHHLTAAQAARGNAMFMVSDHFHATSLGVTPNSLWAALNSGMNYDRTVLALDASGHVVTEIRGGTSSQPDGPIIPVNVQNELTRNYKTIMLDSIPNDQLRRVVAFRLNARPFQFVEFRDVLLQPQSTTASAQATDGSGPGPLATSQVAPALTTEADKTVPPETLGPIIVASGNQAILPNGFNLGIVGLTRATRAGDEWNLYGGPWWSPDGAPITSQNLWDNSQDHESVLDSHNIPPYTFKLIVLPGKTSGDPLDYSFYQQFFGALRPAKYYSRLTVRPFIDGSMPVRFPRAVSASFANVLYPTGTPTCVVRCGIAAGPWRTVAVLPFALKPNSVMADNSRSSRFLTDVSLSLDGKPRETYLDAQGKPRVVYFLGVTGRLPNIARRIVAVDAKGHVIPLYDSPATLFPGIGLAFGKTSDVSQWNPTVDLSQVREFRLQTRPFQTVEFRNVQLQPTLLAGTAPNLVATMRERAAMMQIEQAIQLRSHLQGWAQANKSLLQQMAQARSDDLASVIRVCAAWKRVPIPLWDADPRVGREGDAPIFQDELPSSLTLTDLQRSHDPLETQIRVNFARYRDFVVAQAFSGGHVSVAVWASGRVTRTISAAAEAAYDGGEPVTDDHQEFAGPFFSL